MNSLCFVYCRHRPEGPGEGGGLLNRLFKAASALFKKEEYENWIKRTDLDDNIVIHLIKIPYSSDELIRMGAGKTLRIGRFIGNYCMQNHAECVIPDKIACVHGFEDFSRINVKGRFLYRALLVDMLEKICSVNDKSMYNMDIAVVHGRSMEELKAVISLLSPHVRYLTVLTDEKEQVENELNSICDETGLSIRVTGDRKSCFKNADFLINLGSLKKSFSGNRLRSRTLVFNFSRPAEIEIAGENMIINGIEVRLPEMLKEMLDKELFAFYGAYEIAELILGLKCGCLRSMESVVTNAALMKSVSELFLRDGYTVSGFVGRYCNLKIEDIKL